MKNSTVDLFFREAEHDDLPAIATLLSEDMLGVTRDGMQYLPDYAAALEAINAQAGNTVMVATLGDEVVGVLQLTLIPGLSRGGMLRAQIEGVRVSSQHRGKRIGHQFFEYAVGLARDAGCSLVQLNSDKQRTDAVRFYESLGFIASHEGLKLML
ncbi:GNAT family N-acetyltransferase [Paenalcaligenes niemegkensis]|uniref:GNAT family N-acetyltransferase n=1 Tax=Paenalcaligenes niemegkensis TaxID=2895469 RepID=UPI001EE7AE60|nr:GNAT family N-acetyltransferase [Paenalcaligenes niemegkensis]MCQ9616101.1 GNAT family N-acetyltransferase [Paenalcaligenes niemegkensis]